jgi:hypothetical protein
MLSAAEGAPWGEPCGVAVDGAGNVYVGLWGGGPEGAFVNRYTPAGPAGTPVTDSDYSGSLSGLDEVCNITADSEGNIWADTYGSGPVTRYDKAQFNTKGELASGTFISPVGSTLAADPSSGDVYVDDMSEVLKWTSNGELLAVFGSLGGSYGIAVNAVGGSGTFGDVYVAGGSKINVYGTPLRTRRCSKKHLH